MAEVCSVVPVSFVSLLGDNFYPTGVSSVDDPKFVSHFEVPFGHPALQRVRCAAESPGRKSLPFGTLYTYYTCTMHVMHVIVMQILLMSFMGLGHYQRSFWCSRRVSQALITPMGTFAPFTFCWLYMANYLLFDTLCVFLSA